MPNLVHCLSQTLCSLAGTPRGRQDSSCLGPDLALLEATSLKGPAQEGRGADRWFGAYHLLYLREGERTRLTCRSRAIHPALTALTACGAVCAALHGLGQPKTPQPHGVHTSNLDASLRSCYTPEVTAGSGRVSCSCWVPRSRSRFPVHGRHPCRHGRLQGMFRASMVAHLHLCNCLMASLHVLSEYRLRGIRNAFVIETRGSI